MLNVQTNMSNEMLWIYVNEIITVQRGRGGREKDDGNGHREKGNTDVREKL